MLLLLYNLFLLVFLVPCLVWRLAVRGKSREGLAVRFGRVPALGAAPTAGRVWVHAVSVGETVAAAPVFSALQEALPGVELLLSTTTPTGQAQARRMMPDAALHFYFPFDLPGVVDRVLTRLQPSAIVLMEAEIWPNLLAAAGRRRVPVIIANGHISDRTLRRGVRLRSLLAPVLAGISRYLAQSAAIRDRALALGMPPERVTVAGHTKCDQEVPRLSPPEAAEARAHLGLAPGQPLLLAGSTHEGEEELILDAWQQARRRVPDLALMLAPRHLDRVPALRSLVERRGLIVHLRSEAGALGQSPEVGDGSHRMTPRQSDGRALDQPVLVLDTMGELARFYGLAAVAFVGGSLVPKGGHDILQPLFHGVPTLFGPHMQNQRALAGLVLDAGAGRQVEDAGALTAAVIELLTDEGERATRTVAAARLLAESRGAAARCAAVVAELIGVGCSVLGVRTSDLPARTPNTEHPTPRARS